MTEDEMVSITDSVDMNLSKLWEIAEDQGATVHGAAKIWHNSVTEQQCENKSK